MSPAETRNVQGFSEVVMQGQGEILLEQGEQAALVVEASESLLPRIKTEVVGNRLVLGFEHWWDWLIPPWGPIRYRLTMKTVNGVAILGSGSLVSGRLQTDQCKLKVSGSGRMEVGQLTAQALVVSISGSGRVGAGGEAERQQIRISGSGSVQTDGLKSQEAEVEISGSGRVHLQAHKSLKVRISGSGTVRYLGQPAVSHTIHGSGTVEPLGKGS